MSHELAAIQHGIEEFRERLEKFKKHLKEMEVDMDKVNAALALLTTDVNALIASKGQAGITSAEAQSIVDAITAISKTVEAATVPVV